MLPGAPPDLADRRVALAPFGLELLEPEEGLLRHGGLVSRLTVAAIASAVADRKDEQRGKEKACVFKRSGYFGCRTRRQSAAHAAEAASVMPRDTPRRDDDA